MKVNTVFLEKILGRLSYMFLGFFIICMGYVYYMGFLYLIPHILICIGLFYSMLVLIKGVNNIIYDYTYWNKQLQRDKFSKNFMDSKLHIHILVENILGHLSYMFLGFLIVCIGYLLYIGKLYLISKVAFCIGLFYSTLVLIYGVNNIILDYFYCRNKNQSS